MPTTQSRGATSESNRKQPVRPTITATPSTIQFLGDWREEQHGTIERGSKLTLDYDKTRLPGSFAPWRDAELGDIVAFCRFHPRGDIVTGSVVAPSRARQARRVEITVMKAPGRGSGGGPGEHNASM